MPRSHKTVKDRLDETLGVVNTQLVKNEKEPVEILPPAPEGSLQKYSRPEDFKPKTLEQCKFAQDTYHHLIEEGRKALEGALELAQDSESPRAYEVVGTLIKNISDVATALSDLQKKITDISGETAVAAAQPQGPSGGDTFVFTGSTGDLLKMVNEARGKK